MQPDKASAVMAAMIEYRNARPTRTGAIPHNETAPVLHRLWLINRVACVPDAVQRFFSGAPQSRDRTKHRRPLRPRLCSAPLREELRAALRPGHSRVRSGADAGADRAGHAGAAEPAITGRI